MITIDIPGRDAPLVIQYVALDYNGTIARDGQLLPEASARIDALSRLVPVYILTADTYGNVACQCRHLDATVKTFPRAEAAACKLQILNELGAGACAIGNGFNDIPMLNAAELAIAVMDTEGVCAGLIAHADILTRSAADALDLLLKPDRLRATLRT